MRHVGRDALGRRYRHIPGVDHVDIVVAILGGKAGGPLVGLVLAEIDVANIAAFGARDAAPRPRRRSPERRQAVAHVLLDDLAEEGDALPGLAIEPAALRPPDAVLAVT